MMETTDEQARKIAELTKQLQERDATMREVAILARREIERIDRVLRESDARVARYRPILERAGLLERRSPRRFPW
jgi:methyl-accepting chemotaxis protein